MKKILIAILLVLLCGCAGNHYAYRMESTCVKMCVTDLGPMSRRQEKELLTHFRGRYKKMPRYLLKQSRKPKTR